MPAIDARSLHTRWGEAAAALAFNLIPIFGVLVWHWSVFPLLFLYWLENVVIGVRTLASMLASGLARGFAGLVAALALGAFFTLHYGMFCMVHGLFVVSLFGGGAYGAFTPFETIPAVMAATPNLGAGLLSIAIWQFVLFVLFLARGEARRVGPDELMTAPYARVAVLHLTIMAGGMLTSALGEPLWALLVLALIKTASDVGPRLPRSSMAAPAGVGQA